MVVDFPAPFGPRNPKISHFFTSKDIHFTASKSQYFLTKCLISIILSDLVGIFLKKDKFKLALR
jgi:hypothetical protein